MNPKISKNESFNDNFKITLANLSENFHLKTLPTKRVFKQNTEKTHG